MRFRRTPRKPASGEPLHAQFEALRAAWGVLGEPARATLKGKLDAVAVTFIDHALYRPPAEALATPTSCSSSPAPPAGADPWQP